MAVPCMPSSARMPIEKMRIPISASISITPACFWFVRMAVSLVAEPWIGVVGHGRIAHAHLTRGRNVEAEAAHRARGVARAAAPSDVVVAWLVAGRVLRADNHCVRRASCAAALRDAGRQGRLRGVYVAQAGGIN